MITNKLFIIESLPLFAPLSPLQKLFIATRSEITEYKKGETIYEEGDPPDYFYCVITGRLEIYHPPSKTTNRQELIIEYLRKGDYFGSISSLTGQPHTVSARALNDSAVLLINTKNFNLILKKIPKLAVFLSHSLSRRLSRKGVKEIMKSTIIGVYDVSPSGESPFYPGSLEESLKKEAGKKVIVVKSASMSRKKDVSSKLSLLTENYHYVLVDVSDDPNGMALEILRQSDICHILGASDKVSLAKAASLIRRIESSFSKDTRQEISVILKEDEFYYEKSYGEKIKILSKNIFASLPQKKDAYKKAVRRIAREISGTMVGVAMGSGGAMGFAHIGVLKVLEKEKIPVDIIAGTSIGAFIAALWAAGFTAAEIERIACSFKSSLSALFLVDLVLPVRGLIKGKAVRRMLESYLGDKTFFDVKLPLKIVACDIKKRKEFIIDKGRLVDAVMASIAIPGVFEPVEYNGVQLVDGGIVNPVPVSVLSREGVKRIIAINTLPSPEDIVRAPKKRLSLYDAIVNSFQATEYTMATYSCQQADVYLNPIPKLADWHEFHKAKIFIKTGYDHATAALAKIKELLKK